MYNGIGYCCLSKIDLHQYWILFQSASQCTMYEFNNNHVVLNIIAKRHKNVSYALKGRSSALYL